MLQNNLAVQLHNYLKKGFISGKKFNAVIADSSATTVTFLTTEKRALFIKPIEDIILSDYDLTATGLVASLYRDVYLPIVHTATITVTHAATATKTIIITLDGVAHNVNVTSGNTVGQVATAIAAVIDALDDYTASATNEVVTIAHAVPYKVAMVISFTDSAVTSGVTVTIANVAVETANVAQSSYDVNDSVQATASTLITLCPATVNFATACVKATSKVLENMVLNHTNIKRLRTLKAGIVYAILIYNPTGLTVTLTPQIEWIEGI
jgi:hypothetical protein